MIYIEEFGREQSKRLLKETTLKGKTYNLIKTTRRINKIFSGKRTNHMKVIPTLFLFVVLVLFCSQGALAANHYIRDGATGSSPCTSGWGATQACDSLPSTLTRGDTYYIADGNYGSYNFNDATSGTTLINIKKATPFDHGTDTGWSGSYGDGQAVFDSVITFSTNYWVFDGQSRNENDWFDGDSYGFRISHNNKDQNIIVTANNIAVKCVYINALQSLPGQTIRRYAIDTDSYGGAIRTGLLFHRMYVYGSNNVWFLRTTKGAIVEYSASEGVRSNATNHGEIWNLYYSGDNAIIRYNKIKDVYINDPGTAIVAITAGGNDCQFYGNVVWDFAVTDGAFGYLGGTSTGNLIYNNTFVDSRGGYYQGIALSGASNISRNNLWVNCKSVSIGGTQSNNVTNGSTSVFNNYNNDEFTLSGTGNVINTGYNLGSPYNTDLAGNIRGTSGGWSIGAFEYSDNSNISNPVIPSTPTNLRVVSQ